MTRRTWPSWKLLLRPSSGYRRVGWLRGTWWHTYLPAPHHCTHGRGNPLHAWFRELGIVLRSHEKRLPAAMYGASDAEVCLFLRHLWATDGCVWLRAR